LHLREFVCNKLRQFISASTEGSGHMTFTRLARVCCLIILALLVGISPVFAQVAFIEFSCPTCGFRQQFMQGSKPSDQARNLQHIIVVCERSQQIRNITIPLDPEQPVKDEPLIARQYGTGRSELLDRRLPRFLVPGNTCPLFPVAAYLEQNICPVHGSTGLRFTVVSQY
jgi:hypothetical protein